MVLPEVLPIAIKIGKRYKKLIGKDTSLPAESSIKIPTAFNGQTYFEFCVLQGEKHKTKSWFILSGISPRLGEVTEARFKIDEKRILGVSVKDSSIIVEIVEIVDYYKALYSKDEFYKILSIKEDASQNDIQEASKYKKRIYSKDTGEEEIEEIRGIVSSASTALSALETRAKYHVQRVFKKVKVKEKDYWRIRDILKDFKDEERDLEAVIKKGDYYIEERVKEILKPDDIYHDIEITKEEAEKGCEIPLVKSDPNKHCEKCGGIGFIINPSCHLCNGMGKIGVHLCPLCFCHECDGTGKKIIERITVQIPPNTVNGTEIRIPDKGVESTIIPDSRGDLVVKVKSPLLKPVKPPIKPPVIKPEPTTGSIFVSSSPTGAKVYLDGTYKGTTPCTISDVSIGFQTHEIKLSKNGYSDCSRQVTVEAGETTTINVPLPQPSKSTIGSIYVPFHPHGAKIYFGDSYKGATPRTITGVREGSYEITLRKDGYEPRSITITVEGGKTTSVKGRLKPLERPEPVVERPEPVKRKRLIKLPSSFKVNWSQYTDQLSHAKELDDTEPEKAYQIYNELKNKTGPSLIKCVLLGAIPGLIGFFGQVLFVISLLLISGLLGSVFEDKKKIWQLPVLFGIISIIAGVVITTTTDINSTFNYTIARIQFTLPNPIGAIVIGAIWGALLGSVIDDRKKEWQLAVLCGVGFGIGLTIGVGIFVALCVAYGVATINPFAHFIQFGFTGVIWGAFMGYAVFYAHDKLRYIAMLSREGAKRCRSRLNPR